MSVVRQHLIDPISCIRCDGCRLACGKKAISKIDGTLVVDFGLCDGAGACVGMCDTGAIASWRIVPADKPYSLAEQAAWGGLPDQAHFADAGDEAQVLEVETPAGPHAPPSAPHPQIGLFRDSAPATAVVVANYKATADDGAAIHHVVLDVSASGMVLAEGQSMGVLAPGRDETGAPHAARLYSVGSARSGEGGIAGHVAFTVKRVTEDHDGNACVGVCSNYLCDLAPGAAVAVTGPFGATFLLPEDPAARLLMICTGTGIAPMRGMINHWVETGQARANDLRLVYGGRPLADLPYVADLADLVGRGQLALDYALSRESGHAKTYVQDIVRAEACTIAAFLADADAYVYVCGTKGMEEGLFAAFTDVFSELDGGWSALREKMLQSGRLHIETY